MSQTQQRHSGAQVSPGLVGDRWQQQKGRDSTQEASGALLSPAQQELTCTTFTPGIHQEHSQHHDPAQGWGQTRSCSWGGTPPSAATDPTSASDPPPTPTRPHQPCLDIGSPLPQPSELGIISGRLLSPRCPSGTSTGKSKGHPPPTSPSATSRRTEGGSQPHSPATSSIAPHTTTKKHSSIPREQHPHPTSWGSLRTWGWVSMGPSWH